MDRGEERACSGITEVGGGREKTCEDRRRVAAANPGRMLRAMEESTEELQLSRFNGIRLALYNLNQ